MSDAPRSVHDLPQSTEAAPLHVKRIKHSHVVENVTMAAMTSRSPVVSDKVACAVARIEGKLDLVISKLDDVRGDNRATRATQWVIGLGLAALIIAVTSLLTKIGVTGS